MVYINPWHIHTHPAEKIRKFQTQQGGFKTFKLDLLKTWICLCDAFKLKEPWKEVVHHKALHKYYAILWNLNIHTMPKKLKNLV